MDSDCLACVRRRRLLRVSQRWVLCRRGARARAEDKGLLWLYLLYKVRAQLISQAAKHLLKPLDTQIAQITRAGRDKYVTKMTGADVEHSAQIKFNGVILHAIDACDVRRRLVASRVVAKK